MAAGRNGWLEDCPWKEVKMNKRLIFLIRLVVGGIFIWAGILKIINPLGFADDILNYRVVSGEIAFFAALIIPWVELIAGFFLVAGIFKKGASFILSAMLFVFMVLIALTIIRGINIECGCFGSVSREVNLRLLLVDAVLFAGALFVFIKENITPEERPAL